MKSLTQVLEMKNQQIHQQEKQIIELEKLVSWSVSQGEANGLPATTDVHIDAGQDTGRNPVLPRAGKSIVESQGLY